MRRKIAILGSTGSIGQSSLRVIRKLKPAFQVTGLTAHQNIQVLARQIKEFRPPMAAIMDESLVPELESLVRGTSTRILGGRGGLVAVAGDSGTDLVLSAIVGAAGLKPTLTAIRKGKTSPWPTRKPWSWPGKW